MDASFWLLAINTLANIQNVEINQNRQQLDDINKKMDKIIELLEGRLKIK